jgi:hypothetical protein
MRSPIKILLQTTIVASDDDWSIARFSRLVRLLRSQSCELEQPVYAITARDRETPTRSDPVLATLDESDFDQVWLFAVDAGDGLRPEELASITRFREAGGGLVVTRDHMDLGCSVCSIGGVGAAHHFHTHNPHPDAAARSRDDPYTTAISWPNFHSGANGDYQTIEPVLPIHPVLCHQGSPTGAIRHLPAHPHEGSVDVPPGSESRIIARGRSKATGCNFNIAVVFERSSHGGRAIAQSTFHHFADYNWGTSAGAPSFVTEPPGDGIDRHPEALADTKQYALNIASWLGVRGT